MKAVKANKEYTISESQKATYQAEGFDIVGDNGEVIGYGRGKTVPYEMYLALQKENETLKAQIKASGKGNM